MRHVHSLQLLRAFLTNGDEACREDSRVTLGRGQRSHNRSTSRDLEAGEGLRGLDIFYAKTETSRRYLFPVSSRPGLPYQENQ